MPKVLPPPPIPEIPLDVLLDGFDDKEFENLVRRLQSYERELKQRRSGKILFISLKACNDLRLAVYAWDKIREITDRLRQLRNKPEEEQVPYKHLVTLVTEAQYALAEIFTDATTPCSTEEYFNKTRANPPIPTAAKQTTPEKL